MGTKGRMCLRSSSRLYMAALLLTLLVAIALICILGTWLRKVRGLRDRPPLPPGPPPLPIVGNAFSVPTTKMAQAFRKMNQQYGDVVYLEAFGQPIVLLGTHEAAVDLLEKRSAKYSDRPRSTMADLTGWDWALPIMAYGPWWRRNRRAFHEFFNQAAIAKYRPIQLDVAHRFLLRLLKDPQNLSDHVRYAFGAGIVRIAYGIDIDKEDIPYLEIATETMATFGKIFVPGKWLVETFPILRFLPSWLPGAHFKRQAQAWYPVVQRLRDVPYNAVLKFMREGTAPPSILNALLERTSALEGDASALAEELQIAKDIPATAYGGGSDTIYTTTVTLFLAMASYPDVQKRAQAELDAVVGPDRLPTFEDQPNLPYIAAIIKECTRWRVVLPLGLVHQSTEDDVYRGYSIPKGTHVIPNAWSYTRDTRHYPDPEEFRPERYLKDGKLDPTVLDPGDIIFGYGRR
ncbi:CyP450 monooxygenase [Trametes cingulata]|nr:CyP450 monooxygenase [Trametes cingulata]